MLLTDGRRTVRIEMRIWNGRYYTPDWSEEFFEAGLLMRSSNTGAYYVDDIDYCIDQANDWANKEGDFADDGFPSAEDRVVFVREEIDPCI